MGKGSIKIASPQNATRQLNWPPTYTLLENSKLTHFNTEQCSRYGTTDRTHKPTYDIMNSKDTWKVEQ